MTTTPTPPRVLNLGIFGAGTVGGGVVDICGTQKAFFESLGIQLRIAKICVRSLDKPRDFEVPSGTTFTTSFADILEDPEIDCVLELIGGVTHAKDVVFGAIKAGKHVVTANKALVAEHMDELVALLAEHPAVRFGLEAAVCGGIPIISLLQNGLLPDSVQQLAGIMNGTTNFILSKMEAEGADYGAVLKEAQDLGFAESDPSADVDGYDVRAKIAILAKLAFGTTVELDSIPMDGITRISSDDFAYAKLMGCAPKLLGVARVVPGAAAGDSERLSIFVAPVMVPKDNAIATTTGATNIVEVRSASLQVSSFVGQGAGRFPTANSVMADVLAIALGRCASRPFQRRSKLAVETNYSARFYVRIRIKDQLGIIRKVGSLCEKHGVSIHAIHQIPIVDKDNVPFVVQTEEVNSANVEALCTDLEAEEFCLDRPFAMPLL